MYINVSRVQCLCKILYLIIVNSRCGLIMKFVEEVGFGSRNSPLYFGSDLDPDPGIFWKLYAITTPLTGLYLRSK